MFEFQLPENDVDVESFQANDVIGIINKATGEPYSEFHVWEVNRNENIIHLRNLTKKGVMILSLDEPMLQLFSKLYSVTTNP